MAGSTGFSRFAKAASRATGHALAFGLAAAMIVLWAVAGPFFHFSDTWQLTINTSTTIATFLMVFIIQNTQLRDTEAMHIKLDELMRASTGASNRLLNLEDLPEEELAALQQHYAGIAERARRRQASAARNGRRRAGRRPAAPEGPAASDGAVLGQAGRRAPKRPRPGSSGRAGRTGPRSHRVAARPRGPS